MSAWIEGKVRYFDKKRGVGIIQDEEGHFWDVHYSAIESDEQWKLLDKDAKVKFQAVDDPDFLQVLKCREVRL